MANIPEELFKELFLIFEKYGKDLNLYCQSDQSKKLVCQNFGSKLTDSENKLLEKIKKILGSNHLEKLQKLQLSYENYKKTGSGRIKFKYSNGQTTFSSIAEIMNGKSAPNEFSVLQEGSRSKSSKPKPKSPKSKRKTSSPKSSLTSDITGIFKEIGKSFIPSKEQVVKGITEKGKQLISKSKEQVVKSIAEKGKQLVSKVSEQKQRTSQFEDNMLEEIKSISLLSENSKKTMEKNNQEIIQFLEKLVDTTNTLNKNIANSNEKMINIMETLSDTTKDVFRSLDKVNNSIKDLKV